MNTYRYIARKIRSGSGTEADPFKITSAGDLVKLADIVNSGDSLTGSYFRMTGDIDLSSVCGGESGWVPVGCGRDIVFNGDLYRLGTPYGNDFYGMMYVSEDQSRAVVFTYCLRFRQLACDGVPFKLQGLDPDRKYRVVEQNVDRSCWWGDGKAWSGSFLAGVHVDQHGAARVMMGLATGMAFTGAACANSGVVSVGSTGSSVQATIRALAIRAMPRSLKMFFIFFIVFWVNICVSNRVQKYNFFLT